MIVDRVEKNRWDDAQEFELDYWKTYINDPDIEWKKWAPYFMEHLGDEINDDYSEKILLELGTGPVGMISKMKAKKRIGVEPLANKLKGLNESLYEGMEMISHGAESIPEVKDESVDVVFCLNVLDHVQSVEEILSETVRVLKKGGKFILACDLKSQMVHLDRGHPIAVSWQYFNEWIAKNPWKVVKLKKVKSRSLDANGHDQLDGTIIFVGEKK